jgi:transposase
LQRCDHRQIEECAQSSLRTVQRWARAVRHSGPEALSRNHHYLPRSKLSKELRAFLLNDLRRPPQNAIGKGQCGWSGGLLMRHLMQRYGV